MAQGSSILTLKVNNSSPWKHNYSFTSDYGRHFFIRKNLNRFFYMFFARGVTYRIQFLRFKNVKNFLNHYYSLFKIHEGRKRFSAYATKGVYVSQVWVNYIRDWVVISITAYRVSMFSRSNLFAASLIRMKVFFDSLLDFNLNFNFINVIGLNKITF